MASKLQFGVLAGVLALSLGAGFALADMSPDDTIKARQACMKSHGAIMKLSADVMKGAAAFDAAAFKAAFAAEDAACANYGKFWGADTKKGTAVETHALPAIWEDQAGFQAAGKAWYDAEQKLRAATDQASVAAALPALGGTCKGCHEKFRAPIN